jgi:hypothetical protein
MERVGLFTFAKPARIGKVPLPFAEPILLCQTFKVWQSSKPQARPAVSLSLSFFYGASWPVHLCQTCKDWQSSKPQARPAVSLSLSFFMERVGLFTFAKPARIGKVPLPFAEPILLC